MNRTLFGVCVLVVGLFSMIARSAQAGTPKGSVCWPLHFAGITVGETTDSQVQRLLGRGVFRPDEGHSGGRYFVDTKATATTHVVEGVDRVVDELTLSSGIDRALRPSEHSAAISKWLEPQEGFGNWHALHLGSSRKDVLENLGEPQKMLNSDEWLYESTCTCELPNYLVISFKNDRVIQLGLSEEE
jgi:hypothetical protein